MTPNEFTAAGLDSSWPDRVPSTHLCRDIWACDFLQLYDVLFRPIFAFFFVVHGTREAFHFNVTRCPTDAWVGQRLRQATPSGDEPKYLIRDKDDKFGGKFDAVAEGTGIDVVKIPPSSSDLNPIR